MFNQIPNILNAVKDEDEFSGSDIMLSALLYRITENFSDESAIACAIVASLARKGHTCLDISRIREFRLSDKNRALLPDAGKLRQNLENSEAAGLPGKIRPLVFAGGKYLYLKKFWDYQESVNSFINRTNPGLFDVDRDKLSKAVNKYFSTSENGFFDWQKGAAICAASNRFSVITGGPGTGKTTTAAKIIAIIHEIMKESGKKPRTVLAAPTGKAAARLSLSIKEAVTKLFKNNTDSGCDMPESALTLHRLLGIGGFSSKPRYNRENPLPVDILLVDEASMVDLAMMAALMEAMPASSRLILMGDKDQLSSVEPGSVLADICEAGPPERFSEQAVRYLEIAGIPSGIEKTDMPGFYDGVAELDKSYRFDAISGIGTLAESIRNGYEESALEILESGKFSDIKFIRPENAEDLLRIISGNLGKELRSLKEAKSPEDALAAVESFRILCAVKEGIYGVSGINLLVKSIMSEKDGVFQNSEWYHGRPVMITSNDYQLGLFNGDTGIAMEENTEAGKNIRVFFDASGGKTRALHPARLCSHDTVYAATVHKSQGSEFDRVVLVLPDFHSGALSRELIYTAVTRAKKEFILVGKPEIFVSAVKKRTERVSGMKDRLLGVF